MFKSFKLKIFSSALVFSIFSAANMSSIFAMNSQPPQKHKNNGWKSLAQVKSGSMLLEKSIAEHEKARNEISFQVNEFVECYPFLKYQFDCFS